MCSKCGNIKSDLKLSDRIYKCDKCWLEIDRDLQASINIKNFAYK
jgi:putative transposase